jgi:hypothetical protein
MNKKQLYTWAYDLIEEVAGFEQEKNGCPSDGIFELARTFEKELLDGEA